MIEEKPKRIYITRFVKPVTRFPYRCFPCHIDGYPTERPMREYSYSYSAHTLYYNGWTVEDNSVDSDRLRLWYDDYRELKEEYLGRGDRWSVFKPEQIENFLSILFCRKVTLTGIEQTCNYSNGFPYWSLYYREEPWIESDKYRAYIFHDTEKYTVVVSDKQYGTKHIIKTYKYMGCIGKYLDKYGINLPNLKDYIVEYKTEEKKDNIDWVSIFHNRG